MEKIMKNNDQKLKKVLFIFSIIVIIVIVLFITKRVYAPISDSSNIITVDNTVLGNKEDLVSFSINPGATVSGVLDITGSVKGGYFFEGNILINILDSDKNILKNSHVNAKTDWMTIEPVEFSTTLDITGLSKGPAYIEIHNDNASGLPENDKNILIPIIIN